MKLIDQLTYRRIDSYVPLTDIGHYAGIIDLGNNKALGITIDGVGSKVMIANYMHDWSTIGIDVIAMNVNDLLAMGITPISFIDYIGIDNPVNQIGNWTMTEIGKGLNRGAEIANVSIVGGETAVLPDIIKGFDLVGAAVGIVDKDKIITGDKIEVGDAIVGLPSTGVHSNGFTLVRDIIENSDYTYFDDFQDTKETIGGELLSPTKIYMEILQIIDTYDVHGLAHITGGGLTKLHRITKFGFDIIDPFEPQAIFKFLQEKGNVSDIDMYKTFNMGMGFCVVLPQSEAKYAARVFNGKVVGKIIQDGIYVNGFEIK